MSPNPSFFKQLLFLAAMVTLWSLWYRLSTIRLGRPAPQSGSLGSRMLDACRYGLFQKRVTAVPFGYNHLVLSCSFLLLLLHHPMVTGVDTVLEGKIPAGSLIPYPKAMLLPVAFFLDLLALLGFSAAIIAFGRRIFSPPYPEGRSCGSLVMPLLFAAIFCAYFGVNAFKINEFLSAESQAVARSWLPVSAAIAAPLAGMTSESSYGASWWLHGAAVLFLILCLPYSKFTHILTAMPNCFFRRREESGYLPPEEFVPGAEFGVNSPDRFTTKDLLDTFSCTECGRCQNACPANITGKPLNPRLVISAIRSNLLENRGALKQGNKPAKPLIGAESLKEEVLWACTTCRACMEACPVFIEQMPKIIQMRRHQVEMESVFPEELLNLFENMEGRSNPWGIAPSERVKWCSLMEVPPFEKDKTEYLYYVGCSGSFDSRSKHVTVAMAQLLDRAGVTWGILGKDEKCCGDSLRRLGNEYVFDRMARENVEIFKQRGVKKVIVQCPHCFSTLKNDYRQYGLELEVIHHSELLRNLIEEGRLKVSRQVTDLGQTVFHDSCYLGRHNGIYDAPRQTISFATGSAPAEMGRMKGDAFCCGAGGGRMWMEEHEGSRININRVNEALESRPNTICTACPFCMTMFEDGLKDVNAGSVRVKDVAEIVAEAVLR